jgi:hypothetical protein
MRQCENCGAAFTPVRNEHIARFCCNACRQTQYRRRRGIRPRSEVTTYNKPSLDYDHELKFLRARSDELARAIARVAASVGAAE